MRPEDWGSFSLTACALLGTDALMSFFALPGMASMMLGRGALLAIFCDDSVNDLALGGYRAYYSQCVGDKPWFLV